ncbi:DNA topoisomerase [Ancylostoma caninum]|uniref:DNA topoisomerase n=1 Tax=Ancylostoma caninum TaxID=29170 RepID=A0A368GV05_ANCCA|nr:DNA topoisomerase [Ancylostoma caninum]
MEHCFGSDMKNWQSVPVRTLFEAPIYQVVPEAMKNIAKTLVEESASCDVLVIWTDCDREGESIGAEIARVCKESNPRIDVFRAKFSEITPRAIEHAARHLTRLDQRIIDAVECRSELDLRIGAAFTRLQTLHLQQRFPHILNVNGKQVVSYGSCQFPTLGFVVERYKAIERFISETYWKLVVDHKRGDSKAEFVWDRVRLFDQDIVQILYDDCVEARSAKIETVSRRPKSKFRPQALDTVELEKLAVRKLKMSAKHAMDIAEKLYNKGYISYPRLVVEYTIILLDYSKLSYFRTETNKFPPDINLQSLVSKLTSSAQWGDFANEILEHGPNPRNGTKSDEAHPPIHPLKHVADGSLQGDDWRVYELVVRHFLACLSWDAKGQETRVGVRPRSFFLSFLCEKPRNCLCLFMFQMRIGGETFHATGLCIQDLGYLRVYPYDRWSDKTLPSYIEGEQLLDYQLRVADGQTQPPELLNEADLIALMDKYGIGTDATHAEHIEKIKTRQYVGVRDDGRFIPGYLGLALVDGYDAMGYAMSKPQLRANLELQLQAICAGERTKQEANFRQKSVLCGIDLLELPFLSFTNMVLEEQLGKYRRIFLKTEEKVNLLSDALTRYLNMNSNSNHFAAPPNNGGVTNGAVRGGRAAAAGSRRGRQAARNDAVQIGSLDFLLGLDGAWGFKAFLRNGLHLRSQSFVVKNGDNGLPAAGTRPGRGRTTRGRAHGRRGDFRGGRTTGPPRVAAGNDAADKQCICGIAAVQRTVQKEGPNKGKKFWCCSKAMGQPDKCNFFEWVG